MDNSKLTKQKTLKTFFKFILW